MTYPISFRRKVVAQIKQGMSRTEAAHLFKISRNTLYLWLNSEDLSPKAATTRRRKIDKAALAKHVEDYPEMYLRERAAHFGVSIPGMCKMMKRMGYRKKKNSDT